MGRKRLATPAQILAEDPDTLWTMGWTRNGMKLVTGRLTAVMERLEREGNWRIVGFEPGWEFDKLEDGSVLYDTGGVWLEFWPADKSLAEALAWLMQATNPEDVRMEEDRIWVWWD